MARPGVARTGLPLQLQPEVHLGDARPDEDLRSRLASSYAALYPPPQTPVQVPEDGVRPLLTLRSADEVLATVPRESIPELRIAAKQVLARLMPHLTPPLGTVSVLEMTCLQTAQAGFDAGTAVLVRKTDQLTEQYVLPRVRVNLANGTHGMVNLPTFPAPRAHVLGRFEMDAGAPSLMGGPLTFLLSISPFLPPPWGVAATGTLTLIKIIGAELDKGPSPYEQLKTQLREFVITDDIRQQQGVLTEVSDHFQNMVSSLTMTLDQITTVDGGAEALGKYVDNEGLPKVRSANGQLWTLLLTRNVDNFDSVLALLVRGVSLDILLDTASVKIEALTAAVDKKNGDLAKFNQLAQQWIAHVGTIAKDIGASATEPWTDATIQAQLESTSWIPKIEAWMAKAKSERLAKISTDTYHVEVPSFAYAPARGYTWRDDWLPDNGENDNIVYATPPSGGWCCGDWVEHKDVADANLAAYRNKISSDVDAKFATHRQTVDSWATTIATLHELLPPLPTVAAPTVAPKADGLPTPQPPDWVNGASVRYTTAIVNTNGPSPNGPWSDEMKVGAKAFATLSDLEGSAAGDSLWIYRQTKTPGADWGPMTLVGIQKAPIPATYDDVYAGD